MRIITALLALIAFGSVHAQQKPQRELLQFSGVVVTGDSLAPVPFTSILVKGSYRGTVSDVYGYFSFVAQEGDTLTFAAVGFKRSSYIIPTGLSEKKYSMIHQLYPDTIMLRDLQVSPWPSKEQFREAFLNLDLADDDYLRAMKNMSPAQMLQRMEDMPPDAAGSYQTLAMLDQTKLYTQNGMPVVNLMNPVAWAQFLQAWRNGAYKKK